MTTGQYQSQETTVPGPKEPPGRRTGSQAGPHLIVLRGPNVGQVFPLTDDQVVIGRGEGDIRLVDSSVSRRHLMLERDAAGAYHIEDLDSRNGTFIDGKRIGERHQLAAGNNIGLGVQTVIRYSVGDNAEVGYAQQMYEAALCDGATGLFNRRYFDGRLVSEFAFAQRHAKPISLLFIDVDRFKSINDRFGHLAGDAALVHLAELLSELVRTEDVVARFGGEEFAIICRDSGPEQARALAERIRQTVEKTPCKALGGTLSITVSIGVAVFRPPDDDGRGGRSTSELPMVLSPQELVGIADAAMLRAKEQGRNRVIFGG